MIPSELLRGEARLRFRASFRVYLCYGRSRMYAQPSNGDRLKLRCARVCIRDAWSNPSLRTVSLSPPPSLSLLLCVASLFALFLFSLFSLSPAGTREERTRHAPFHLSHLSPEVLLDRDGKVCASLDGCIIRHDHALQPFHPPDPSYHPAGHDPTVPSPLPRGLISS